MFEGIEVINGVEYCVYYDPCSDKYTYIKR